VRRGLIGGLALLTLSSGAHAQTGSCKPDPAAEAKVVDAMKAMYAAATVDDLAGFQAVTTPDFYAFDGGVEFKGHSLMDLVKVTHARGKRYVWAVTEPKVRVTCDSAWVTYRNVGSIDDETGHHPLQWWESANLKREAGVWRIQFLHSTRIPDETR
jgi:hypothetical protein